MNMKLLELKFKRESFSKQMNVWLYDKLHVSVNSLVTCGL